MLSMLVGRLAVASVAPDPQAGVPLQRIEIAVVVQERAVVLDAKTRQQDIDGAAQGAAAGAQAPVVLRRTNGLVFAADASHRQRRQGAPRGVEILLVAKAAQH